jgi:hypothetical protein
MSTDNRDAIRYSYQCQVVVATKEKSCITQLENLSSSGCCVEKSSDWDFDQNDVLNLYFIVENDHVIDAEAMLIWEDGTHAGLQYLHAQAVPIEVIEEK